MIEKIRERKKAINLRKSGFSYSEILKKVPVAKSTLSLWLRSVGLNRKQKQRLTEKKLASMKRGWEACREKRILVTSQIKKRAKSEILNINNRELWLIGAVLYWGEGRKEKEWKSSLVELGNSDPSLIKLFVKWLEEICGIPRKDICFRIFLHETSKHRLEDIKKYWSKKTKFPVVCFQKVSWKKNKINTKRKNIGENYYGLLRVTVKRSTNLNRKIQGWIDGICKYSGVV